ncbi:MAG: zinc ribbon domain-containing protein [Chloroflexi bacterium]|nr:zinc ribbon domain-containing protein [Chloroflexota bacterium]
MTINLEQIIQVAVAAIGAYLAALWLSLILWTYRDIRGRSRDWLTHLMAVVLVAFFNLPGLVLYFILRPGETLAQSYERSLEEEAMLRELQGEMACPTCKRRVEADFLICPNCRTRLKQPCPHCQHPLSLKWEACPYCGQGVAVPQS